MATEQQLYEQNELEKKRLNLSQQQIEEAYNLSKKQIDEIESETKAKAGKLAQQTYITKQQTEKVLPNILSAQGLANTGYENVRKGQIQSSYQGQQGEIQSDLQSNIAGLNRQRANEELRRKQQLDALALQREAAALDYANSLQSLRSKSSGGGSGSGSTSSENFKLINQFISSDIENGLSPDQVGSLTKQYLDEGYITQAEKDRLDSNLKTYAYTYNTGIAPFDIPNVVPQKATTPKATTPKTPTKKAQPTTTQKIQKALAIGQW